MNFWQRVEELCENKGINKKEIAAIAGINPSTISKGLKNNTSPAAEIAVKIAQRLDTNVEYLVTGKISQKSEIESLYKHHELLKKLDSIPPDTLSSIELMISDLSEKYLYNKK